jgi:hypothetical protein
MIKQTSTEQALSDLSKHIITFDSEDFGTHAAFTIRAPKPTLSPIPWPAGKAPKPKKLSNAGGNKDLPKCDVLIVTWTVEEAKALSDVLTPGFNSKASWFLYTKNFAQYQKKLTARSPANKSKCLGKYYMTTIGSKKVLCFKSELHMSTDGIKLPIADLWKQIIEETQCSMVITTGTAGGIGKAANLGDVAISKIVRFDCTRLFKTKLGTTVYKANNKLTIPKNNTLIIKLLSANHSKLPVDSPLPKFFDDKVSMNRKKPAVVTTDFFAFDNAENTYGLQQLGSTVEMGDAVMAMVIEKMTEPPQWLCIRNASDPQIPNQGTLREQAQKAAQIYERYGYWTTVCSAIACWAVIVNN